MKCIGFPDEKGVFHVQFALFFFQLRLNLSSLQSDEILDGVRDFEIFCDCRRNEL